jgi:hypothetical protein
MPLIDPKLIPAEVLRRTNVDRLNALYDRLEARKVDKIVIPEPPSGFRPSNLIRVYCQAHLRRCLVLARSGYGLFFLEDGLVSLMCARAIYESVAVFSAFERQFLPLLETGTIPEILEFALNKAHATRTKKMIEQHGEQVKAVNIVTDIAKLAKDRPKIEEEYDFLSDHVHPAGFGTMLYFAEKSKTEDAYVFSDGGPDPAADLKWVLVSIRMLEEFEKSLDRVEAALLGLSARGHAEKK